MPPHIVITGATGFIGSAIVRELALRGTPTTILLRPDSDTGRLRGIKGFETLHYSDLSDAATADSLRQRKPDVFIHCAWRGVGGRDRNESYQITGNVPAAIHAATLAADAGCAQWIGLGSQAEYGNLNQRINEDAALRPTTLYGKAKLAAGIAALALCEARQISGAWMRVFSTYGPGDAAHWFIPYVIQEFLAGRAPELTNCEQMWDYLYVGDAARAVVALADARTSGVFNLGSGTARPLKTIIETIKGQTGSDIEPRYGAVAYRPDQVMHLEADISRLHSATGWQPITELDDGIRATVAFEKTRQAA